MHKEFVDSARMALCEFSRERF